MVTMGMCLSCCGAMCKVGCCGAGKTKTGSKLIYLVIMFIVIIFGVFIRVYSEDLWDGLYSFDTGCPEEGNPGRDLCMGMMGVYRVSWALFTFFLVMALFTFLAKGFHTGMWFLKIPILVVFLIYPFFIPNSFFEVYADIARVGSILFLLLQALILIDFAHDVSECILARSAAYDDKLDAEGYEANCCGNPWKVLYVFASVGTLLVAIGGAALLYVIPPSCGLNTFFVSQTIAVGLVYTVLSASEKVGTGLLPPAIIFAHSAFLCWSAIRSNPDAECNDAAADSSIDGILVGIMAAAASLTWASFRMGDAVYDAFRCDKGKDSQQDDDEEAARGEAKLEAALTGGADPDTKPSAADGNDDDGSEEKKKKAKKKAKKKKSSGKSKDGDDDDDDDPEDDQKHWPFHLVMALGGLYFGMLLTNWGSLESTDLSAALELSTESMWVKMISQWLSIVLFLVTMFAPVCCTSRDFSDPHNSFAS